MRKEIIKLIKSIENKKLTSEELEVFNAYIIATFSDKQLFNILNFGIKNKFNKNKEELKLEIVSNYSLPIRINNKIDLINSLNYFHHCLSDDGNPCNIYVEKRCFEAQKIIKEVGSLNKNWSENMKSGYKKIVKYCQNDALQKDKVIMTGCPEEMEDLYQKDSEVKDYK